MHVMGMERDLQSAVMQVPHLKSMLHCWVMVILHTTCIQSGILPLVDGCLVHATSYLLFYRVHSRTEGVLPCPMPYSDRAKQ